MLGPFAEIAAHFGKFFRIGPLEAVNRLFRIPNGKDGAGFIGMTPGIDKEFFGQNTHHFPLFGVGILRFVNQDVIKAFVEFEQHPARHAGLTLQQTQAGQDQIIVIKAGMQGLFRRIAI